MKAASSSQARVETSERKQTNARLCLSVGNVVGIIYKQQQYQTAWGYLFWWNAAVGMPFLYNHHLSEYTKILYANVHWATVQFSYRRANVRHNRCCISGITIIWFSLWPKRKRRMSQRTVALSALLRFMQKFIHVFTPFACQVGTDLYEALVWLAAPSQLVV